MNEKTLALHLMAIAANMLANDCVVPTSVEIKTAPTKARGCNCRPQNCPTPPQTPNFNREPDGVQIVVDRPRRENYTSQHKFAVDMANYRCLIDQAKKCENIKTRKPECVPSHVHNNRKDWYDVNEPRRQACPACGCEAPINPWSVTGWGW